MATAIDFSTLRPIAVATAIDSNSEKSIAAATAIDFGIVKSIAVATAIDLSTLKSISVAAAIDFGTLKSIAVATAIDFGTLKSIAVATAIDSDSGHGIRSTRPEARGLGGLPLEKETGLHIVVRAWASTSWCVLGSQGLSCFFHQKRPKHNVFPNVYIYTFDSHVHVRCACASEASCHRTYSVRLRARRIMCCTCIFSL